VKTTIPRVIRREGGLILMSIPRLETGYLGNTKICPVVLAAREELLWANAVPVRANLPAFVYVAFGHSKILHLQYSTALMHCMPQKL